VCQNNRLSLTIALDTLRHLGMNLYSSLPPVLSELVANAYDARARKVGIVLLDDEVVIQDDGIGMDRVAVQEKYLVVGRDRRVDDPPPKYDDDPFAAWPRREKPMGRKGIGKLAMFSIASQVEVHSTSRGNRTALRMVRSDIEQAARNRETYYPVEIPCAENLQRGTRVILKDLKRERAISAARVIKSIARRFSVIGSGQTRASESDFSVSVNDTPVTVSDWDIFNKLQYLWYLGPDSKQHVERCRGLTNSCEVAGEVEAANGQRWTVSGWIGTVKKPEQLKSVSDGLEINDNRIVIDCRGKVAISNFLHQFGEAGVYASYLAGYVRADYLDDDADDIATSDRERMKEDDPRVQALRDFMHKVLKQIQKEWTDLRRESAAREAEHEPVVKEWVKSLNDDEKGYARRLLGRLGGVRFADKSDKAQVIKYAILAFERLRVRHRLHLLTDAPDDSIETIAAMFSLEDDLENALYADIARQRLEVVSRLEQLVDADEKERVVQKHIYEHLWLLEPSWTVQDQLSSRLEKRVSVEFKKVKLTKDEKEGRIDIRYRKSGGVHIIIELKKPGAKRSVYQLLEQVKKYRSALAKCLLEVEGEAHPTINCVCLVGKRPNVGQEEEGALQAAGTQILTYDRVIGDSCKRFSEYVDAQKKYSRVHQILAMLDEGELGS